MSDRSRLGIVGCGSIGRLQREVLREAHRDRFDVVALADDDPAAIAAMEPGPDEELFRDHHDLLACPDVDTVLVSTPPRDHFAMTVDALAAGKNVFVEKPPGLTVAECEEMRRAATRAGRVLFMGFHARYNVVVDLAREQLADETVERCAVVYRENVEDYHAPGSWVFDPDVSGGGVLMDSGVNVLSVLAATVPGAFPLTVTSADLRRPAGVEVETAALVGFGLASGGHGTLDMDWLGDGAERRQITYVTAAHTVVLDLVAEQVLRDGVPQAEGSGPGSGRVDQRAEYRRMFHDLAEHLATGRSYTSTAEVDFVRQAYQSR